MAEILFPAEGEEALLLEAAAISLENQEQLHKDYLDRAIRFDASVINKLDVIGALSEHESWAIFNVGDAVDPTGQGEVLMRPKQVLIQLSRNVDVTDIERIKPPNIRILTSEVTYGEGKFFVLSEDFTIDEDYDTFFFIDAIPVNDGIADFTRSLARIFKTENNRVQVIGRGGGNGGNVSTPFFVIGYSTEKTDKESYIRPFGTYKCVEDRIYALDRAQEIFNEIATLQPAEYSGKHDD